MVMLKKKKRVVILSILLFQLVAVMAVAAIVYQLKNRDSVSHEKSFAAQQPILLDRRLSVTHFAGSYPERTEGDYLLYGAQWASDMGFRTIELLAWEAVCWTEDGRPKGAYQKLDWCGDTVNNRIIHYLSDPLMKKTLELPFDTFFIEMQPSADTSGNVHYITKDYDLVEQKTLLQGTYDEYKEAAKHLLTEYQNTGKTFVIQTMNELDHILVEDIIKPGEYGVSLEPEPQTLKNAIAWFNTVIKAVDDAKAEVPENNMKLFVACEFNSALESVENKGTNAIDDVFAKLDKPCDLYGYSAYEVPMYQGINNPFYNSLSREYSIDEVLEIVASKLGDSEYFGNKNIYIAEVNVSENRVDGHLEKMDQFISNAFSWGVPYLNIWQLFENCPVFLPAPDQCAGNWIVLPNLEPSSLYTEVVSKYMDPFEPNMKAELLEFVPPVSVKPSQQIPLKVKFKNIGKYPWYWNDDIYLGSMNPFNNHTWGLARVGFEDKEIILPGQEKTFSFTATAPAQEGEYQMQWGMVKQGVSWFSNSTDSYTVTVTSQDQVDTLPAKITDLRVESATENSMKLNWTVPENKVNEFFQGYIIAYSKAEITEGNFESAQYVESPPAPKEPLSADSFTVSGLEPNTKYYFAIKIQNNTGGFSEISNVVSAITQNTAVDPEKTLSFQIKLQGISSQVLDSRNFDIVITGDNSVQLSKDLSFSDGSYVLDAPLALTGLQASQNISLSLKADGYLRKTVRDLRVDSALILSEPVELKAGDVNNDNKIDINDVAGLLSYYTDLSVPVNDSNSYMDYSGNGKIDITDVAIILTNYTDLTVRGDDI